MTNPKGKTAPAARVRERVIAKQGGKCLYCDRPFFSMVYRNGQEIELAILWDHMLPWRAISSNPDDNWAAACQVCNSIKSGEIFPSLDAARKFLRARREQKGYRIKVDGVLAATEAWPGISDKTHKMLKTKVCRGCKREFVPYNGNQKWCSPTCSLPLCAGCGKLPVCSRGYRYCSQRCGARNSWTPERRAKMSERARGRFGDPEYKAKRSADAKALWQNPEYRAKMAKIQEDHWADPEFRAKVAKSQEAARQRPGYKEQLSAISKARWDDPEYKERVRAAIIAGNNTPEAKAAHGRASKARWQDPESRERMLKDRRSEAGRANASAKAKERWQDPAKKEVYLELLRQGREEHGKSGTCQTCGKEFKKGNGNQRYCNECRGVSLSRLARNCQGADIAPARSL